MQKRAVPNQSTQNTAISRIRRVVRHEVRVLSPSLLWQHPNWRAHGRWSGGFSLAAWLRFPEGLGEMVQLMLDVRDQERRESYLIDRCLPNRQTLILLNGVVDLTLKGAVLDMFLYLTGPSENAAWILDEYHIEAKQTAASCSTRGLNRGNSGMHSRGI